MRRDYYVYLHKAPDGKIFYVGKGTGKRAWSKDRHLAWNKFVSERLHGAYSVEIYRDGLTEADAELLEDDLIADLGEQLVNWINPGRQFDYDAITKFHELRDKNRQFVQETKPFEKTDVALAVARYREALNNLDEYEAIETERGLVAELSVGPDWGYPYILDRLTLSLIKLGKNNEAIKEAETYFSKYPSARDMNVGKKILKRLQKIGMRVAD